MPKEKIKKAAEKLDPKQRLALLILIIVLIGALVIKLSPPERSVAAYCQAFKEENAKLPKPTDDKAEKFGSAGLISSSSDPRHFAKAYARLEKVAPEEIRYDVRTLRSVFEKMDKDPSQQFAASFSGLGAETSVEDWTKKHCGGGQQ